MEWRRSDGYELGDDPARLDLDRVARWLSEEAYWAMGRPRDVIERSIIGSVNLGLYAPAGDQVGFCRWVTDRATFAWLCDVYLEGAARGRGLGTWMIETAVAHPAVSTVGRQVLATVDAHGLYARVGFEPLATPERWMERRLPLP